MKNKMTKLFACIGAIVAVAAVVFIFRDKIAKLLENCKCKKDVCDLEDLEGTVEDAIEQAEEKAEDFAEAAKEKAAQIAEEFEDYADVEKPEA